MIKAAALCLKNRSFTLNLLLALDYFLFQIRNMLFESLLAGCSVCWTIIGKYLFSFNEDHSARLEPLNALENGVRWRLKCVCDLTFHLPLLSDHHKYGRVRECRRLPVQSKRRFFLYDAAKSLRILLSMPEQSKDQTRVFTRHDVWLLQTKVRNQLE